MRKIKTGIRAERMRGFRAVLSLARSLAAEYRFLHPGYDHGYVLVFDGRAFGWFLDLTTDNAHKVEPLTVAVDSFGDCFVAMGGCSYSGADYWETLIENLNINFPESLYRYIEHEID